MAIDDLPRARRSTASRSPRCRSSSSRGFHHGAILARDAGASRRRWRASASASTAATRSRPASGRAGSSRTSTASTSTASRGCCSDDEHVAEYEPPANVEPIEPGASGELLDGELRRAIVGDVDSPDVAPLLADADEAGVRAPRASAATSRSTTSSSSRTSCSQRAPAARAARSSTRSSERSALYLESGELEPRSHAPRRRGDRAATRCPYGVEPNRGVLEELIDHAVAQRILRGVRRSTSSSRRFDSGWSDKHTRWPDGELHGTSDVPARRRRGRHVVPARYHGSPDSPPLGGVFAYAVRDRRRRRFDATGAARPGRRRTTDGTADDISRGR